MTTHINGRKASQQHGTRKKKRSAVHFGNTEPLETGATPVEPERPNRIALAAAAVDAEDERAGLNVAPDDPHRLARIFLRASHYHAERPTLIYQPDDFLSWDGCRWSPVTKDIEQDLYPRMRAEFERVNKRALLKYNSDKDMTKPIVRRVETKFIGNVKLALRGLVAVPLDQPRPSWLGNEPPFPVEEMLAFPNALVHVPSLAAGNDKYSVKPTPRFFSTRCQPFDFDADAPPPKKFLKFLHDILGEDSEAIELLQEWLGYCLTPDTSQQKIVMITGPPRCGKGTLGRAFAAALGPDAAVGTSFSSLTSHFGASPLIDRTLAIVGDARLSSRTDQAVITERLLSISGEDRVVIDRKFRAPWEGILPTRLMLLSNELPELRDASTALAHRLLIIELKTSFLGRENTKLTDELLEERMGILLWGIEGYRRLHERGHFVLPESSKSIMERMIQLSSPISAFLSACCTLDPTHRTTTEDLYRAYQHWCSNQGKKNVLDNIRFGSHLHAALPGVRNSRIRTKENKIKTPYYLGIGLKLSARENIRYPS